IKRYSHRVMTKKLSATEKLHRKQDTRKSSSKGKTGTILDPASDDSTEKGDHGDNPPRPKPKLDKKGQEPVASGQQVVEASVGVSAQVPSKQGKRAAPEPAANASKKRKVESASSTGVKMQAGIVVAMYGAIGQLMYCCPHLMQDFEEEEGEVKTPPFVLELKARQVYPLWEQSAPADSPYTKEEHNELRDKLIGKGRNIIQWTHVTARGFDWGQAPAFAHFLKQVVDGKWDLTHVERFTKLVKRSYIGDPTECFMSDSFQMQDAVYARTPPGARYYEAVEQNILTQLYESSINPNWRSTNAQLVFSMLLEPQLGALKIRHSRTLKMARTLWSQLQEWFPEMPQGDVLVGASVPLESRGKAVKTASAFLWALELIPLELKDRKVLREVNVTSKLELGIHLSRLLREFVPEPNDNTVAQEGWGLKMEIAGRTLGYLSVVAEGKDKDLAESFDEMPRLAYLRGRAGAAAYGIGLKAIKRNPRIYVPVRSMETLHPINKGLEVELPTPKQLTITMPSHSVDIQTGDQILVPAGAAGAELGAVVEGQQSYFNSRKAASVAEATVTGDIETRGLKAFWNRCDVEFSKVKSIAQIVMRILESGAESMVGDRTFAHKVVRMSQLGFALADHQQAVEHRGIPADCSSIAQISEPDSTTSQGADTRVPEHGAGLQAIPGHLPGGSQAQRDNAGSYPHEWPPHKALREIDPPQLVHPRINVNSGHVSERQGEYEDGSDSDAICTTRTSERMDLTDIEGNKNLEDIEMLEVTDALSVDESGSDPEDTMLVDDVGTDLQPKPFQNGASSTQPMQLKSSWFKEHARTTE
ncbi:unnamed protein product, partial [Mycena citricolor]